MKKLWSNQFQRIHTLQTFTENLKTINYNCKFIRLAYFYWFYGRCSAYFRWWRKKCSNTHNSNHSDNSSIMNKSDEEKKRTKQPTLNEPKWNCNVKHTNAFEFLFVRALFFHSVVILLCFCWYISSIFFLFLLEKKHFFFICGCQNVMFEFKRKREERRSWHVVYTGSSTEKILYYVPNEILDNPSVSECVCLFICVHLISIYRILVFFPSLATSVEKVFAMSGILRFDLKWENKNEIENFKKKILFAQK